MIAVALEDIITSKTLDNQGVWLELPQSLLNKWGDTPKNWK